MKKKYKSNTYNNGNVIKNYDSFKSREFIRVIMRKREKKEKRKKLVCEICKCDYRLYVTKHFYNACRIEPG